MIISVEGSVGDINWYPHWRTVTNCNSKSTNEAKSHVTRLTAIGETSDRFCIIFPCHSRWISTLSISPKKDAGKTSSKGPLTNNKNETPLAGVFPSMSASVRIEAERDTRSYPWTFRTSDRVIGKAFPVFKQPSLFFVSTAAYLELCLYQFDFPPSCKSKHISIKPICGRENNQDYPTRLVSDISILFSPPQPSDLVRST